MDKLPLAAGVPFFADYRRMLAEVRPRGGGRHPGALGAPAP